MCLWWWSHGKHRHCHGRVASLLMQGGRQVAGHIWINTRSRGYFQWACNFWTHIWQGRVILNLQRYCGHPSVINEPTPCKIVQSSGEVVGSHSDRAVYTSLWIPIERVPFELNALLSGVNSQNLNSTNVAGCRMSLTRSQTPGACLVHQRAQDQLISDPRHLSRTPVWTRHCSLALSHRYIVGMSDPFISIILRKSENWRDFSGIFCTDPTNKKYAQGSSFVVFFVVWYSLNNILQDCRTASLIPRTVSIWSPSFQVTISIIKMGRSRDLLYNRNPDNCKMTSLYWEATTHPPPTHPTVPHVTLAIGQISEKQSWRIRMVSTVNPGMTCTGITIQTQHETCKQW